MNRRKVKTARTVVSVQLEFDDGETVRQAKAKLEVRTTVLRVRTPSGGDEVLEGMRQRSVMLRRPLKCSRVGKPAFLTLSNGQAWRVLTKDARTLVQTPA